MSSSLASRLKRATVFALAAASIAAPAASARPADDSIRTSSLAGTVSPAERTDLRSPDTRDAANGIVPSEVAAPTSSRVEQPGGEAFDWSTAGIAGAAVVGMLVLMVAGIGALRLRRRRVLA